MRLMDTAKDDTNAISDFLGRQNSVGLGNFAFSMDPFRFNWVHPWTLDRQITRQYPHTLGALFDFLLCLRIQLRTIWLMCQEGLSHTKTNTLISISAIFWQAHSKYSVEIALIGRPSTKRSKFSRVPGLYVPANVAPATHNKPTPLGQGHPWLSLARPNAVLDLLLPKHAYWVAQISSTTLHLPTQSPNLDVPSLPASVDLVVFFAQIFWIRAGYPLFCPFPAQL